MDYFICKNPKEWDIDAVYDLYKTLNPNDTHEQLLFSIYKALQLLKSLNSPVGAAASNLFRRWNKNKNDLGNKSTSASLQVSSSECSAGHQTTQIIKDNNGEIIQKNDVKNVPQSNDQNDEITDENNTEDDALKNDEATLDFAKWINQFSRMTWTEQLEHLYEEHLGFNEIDETLFNQSSTTIEVLCLASLRQCKTLDDFNALKTRLFMQQHVPPNIEFIRSALHQVSLFWNNTTNILNNLEDWWRIVLYGSVFDHAFASIKQYNVIRSEAESLAYKEHYILSNDVIPIDEKKKSDKVDMIVRTTDNTFDVFSAKDKPLLATHKAVCETIEKNKDRRVITLDIIQKKLPFPELISEFTNYTALWHGNHLMIQATKKINNCYYHYEAAKTYIPLSPNNFDTIAGMLLIVLSLKRHIIYNYNLIDVLANEQTMISLDEGYRSPIPLDDQDDSIEYDEKFIEKLQVELEIESEKESTINIKRYRDAVEKVPLGDNEEDIIMATDILKIYSSTQGLTDNNQGESEQIYEPSYDMLENEKSVVLRFDIPGLQRKEIHVQYRALVRRKAALLVTQ
ncbi:hypothetical protein BDC45DRAFT_530179 [Circinella umbellata]|nr:hypothetical protein BDC45DRAFT_530179 [Circinella umbellata]